jgi:putative N6-adenine-specific DNA methylase
VNDARAAILPAAPCRILGADRDSGAIAAAESNAARAGVSQDLRFEVRTVSALPELGEGAWLVTNPPYGVRVGESEGLRDLYAALGAAARRALPGGVMTMLSADRRLEGQLKLPLEEILNTRNGGIPVRIVRGEV